LQFIQLILNISYREESGAFVQTFLGEAVNLNFVNSAVVVLPVIIAETLSEFVFALHYTLVELSALAEAILASHVNFEAGLFDC
jgi:hypothetical protein